MDKKYLDYQHMRKNKPDTQKSKKRKGDWKQQPLSHFLRERKEKSDGKCEVHSVSVQYGVINQVDFLGRSFAAEDTSNYKLVYPYDVIYTKSPTGSYPYGIVKQNQNPYKVIVSPLYGIFKPQNKYIGYIIQSYFESPNTITKYLAPIIAKGAKNTIQISNELFLSRNVYLPSQPEEQKKIAGFLLSIDKQIEQQRMSLETLMRHKQALMQQLFPQRGEDTPILRFSKMRNRWKYSDLKKITSHCTKKNTKGEETTVLTNSAQYGVVKQQDYFDRDIVTLSNLKNYYLVEVGDFVYNPRVSIAAPVGPVSKNNLKKGIISPLYLVFRFNDSDNDFYVYYFQSLHWQVQLKKIANSGARFDRMSISTSEFFNIQVPDLSKTESEKIASLFLSLDKLIDCQQAKYDFLIKHKKGLMQQLFPN